MYAWGTDRDTPPQPWTAPTATDPVRSTVRLPGSKSMTARALVLSSIANGPSTLRPPLRARDTELMAAGLRAMGTHASTVTLAHPAAAADGPAHVDVGLAGTVMRFLPPVAGLAHGPSPSTATRGPGPPARPADRRRCAPSAYGSSRRRRLPAARRLRPGRIDGGEVVIDASASSQLVSGLLLAAPRFDRGVLVRHVGPPVPSAPHLRMTVQMLRAAGAGVDDSHPRRLGGRAGPADRPRLGHRARPLRRRAVLRRRPGHRRRGHPAGLAAQQRAAGRPAALPCCTRWAAR